MANILELAALKTINMENFSSWAPAQVLKFKSWKDILAIKEATVREHNVFTCICLELSDQDKAIFPHKLPGDCVLEPKQSAKTCDGVGCDLTQFTFIPGKKLFKVGRRNWADLPGKL